MIQKSNQKVLSLLMLLMLALTGSMEVKAQDTSDFTFNSGVRYSQWVTKSRMNSFYRNTTADGFAVYDAEGNKTADGKAVLDYVPGLVAKAIVENVQYYSQYDWAQSWALPFFYSMAGYCNGYYNNVTESGGSLDNLNASKMFFGMYELTNTGGAYASKSIASSTKSHAQTALSKAMNGFVDHNNRFVIGTSTPAYTAGHEIVNGGWWHKSQYENEMWLDGSYMGPALFAQLRSYKGSDIIGDDWTIVYRQIQALWEMCWNPTDKLLYHAFSAKSLDNYSATWAGFDPDNRVFHSASYWGRAVGWYFLALVDILEQMDKAGLTGTDNYNTLKSHLAALCAGLAARQDATSGCWYQILDEDGKFSANSYSGKSFSTTNNYLESSASALFAAGFMKAIRLGYISSATYESVAKKAYEGLVNTFFAADGNDGVHLFGSCRSAGLGGTSGKMPRDGSKAYYLLGGDVARVAKSENVTEGKILGAFILAATEYEKLYQDNTVLFEKDLAPSYELEAGDEISCPATGSGANITYQWYKDGVAVEDATNATIAPTASGAYYCKATSGTTTITSSTAQVNFLTTLFSTNFGDAKWANITDICNSNNAPDEIHNGITFHSNNSSVRKYSVSQSEGTMTWCNNSMGNKYWIAIPVTGVNGSLTITVDNGDDNTNFNYVVKKETTISGNPGSGSSSTLANPATVKISNLDGSDYVVYLGRQSSSYTEVKSIKITTPTDGGSQKTVNTLALSTESDEVTVGNTLDIKGYITNKNNTETEVTYTSNNTSVATVTDAGVITGVAEGETTITVAQAETEEYSAGSATFTITVNAVPVTNHTVTFYDGSQYGIQTIEEGATVEAPAISPTKQGYTFKGWSLENGSTARVLFPYEVWSDVNFYAVWSEDTGGGSGEDVNVTETAVINSDGSASSIVTPNTYSAAITTSGNTNSKTENLVSGYSYALKLESSSGKISIKIPENVTNLSVVLLNKANDVSTLKLNTTATSVSWTAATGGGYTTTIEIADNLAGTTFDIEKGSGSPYINSITFNYSMPGSESTGGDNIFLDAASDYDSFEAYAGDNKTVTLRRNFTEGKWTTLVLPFSVTTAQLVAAFDNDDECELAEIKSMSVAQGKGSIHYTTVNSIEANKPVLARIKPNESGEYVFNGVTVVAPTSVVSTSTDGKVEMHGVYKTTSYTKISEDAYFLSGGKFYDWSYLSNMSPFSAYLLPVGENAHSVQSISFDDEATGIVNVNGNANGNGNANENESYNLAGQRVTKEYNGMVIIKGKKVLKR